MTSTKRKRKAGGLLVDRPTGASVGHKGPDSEDVKSRIVLLESQILESRKHYNAIAELITLTKKGTLKDEPVLAAAFSLRRVFNELMAAGKMRQTKHMPENEVLIVQWLKTRYDEFVGLLLNELEGQTDGSQLTALTMLMRVLQNQGNSTKIYGGYSFPRDLLRRIMQAILVTEQGQGVADSYVENYVNKYDDIRYYTFSILADITLDEVALRTIHNLSSKVLSILSEIGTIPQSDNMTEFYVEHPVKKHPVRSLTSHKSRAQDAWLNLLRLELSPEQRKSVLSLMSRRIAPWFTRVELLMDFLTDSYDIGGSTSLLALSGLFYLIQQKNLDYPQFYHKLYSLLDATILHSRHRSRFFRLLSTFLSSTHLPAALVASFIKRLSRLTLYAPPAGIIIVIPYIYNLLKMHPACTFMIHREASATETRSLDDSGMDDPFDEREPDPMQTRAIESSLWEIHTLQAHYHPNVATLAKIIAEQFTKQEYNLEDFMDHSYAKMLDTELSRQIKKPPVVEYEIPKRVFAVRSDEDSSILAGAEKETLLERLWDFA